jgi:hypothetical protein
MGTAELDLRREVPAQCTKTQQAINFVLCFLLHEDRLAANQTRSGSATITIDINRSMVVGGATLEFQINKQNH